jgi:signal transduction histidine kinase
MPFVPMKWLHDRRRELAAIGCLGVTVVILLVSELGFSEWNMRYQSALGSVTANAKLHSLAARLAEAESGRRGFLTTYKREHLQPYQLAVPEIRRLLDHLRPHYALHPDPAVDKVFTALTSAVGAKLGEIELTLELAQSGRPDRAMEIVNSGIGQRTTEQISYLAADLSLREGASARGIAYGAEDVLALWRLAILLIVAANIVLAAVLWSGMRKDRELALSRRALLDQRVRERTRQLDSLASKLQEAAEAERSALARELHDELGAFLTASQMDISWVKERLGFEHALLRGKLERVLHHLAQGVVAKRRIVEGLRPSALSIFGVATAVRELAEQVAERAEWNLELELPETDARLPQDIEIALFRVVQESLTNAAKYAGARHVRVKLGCRSRHCTLEVSDDGRGFQLHMVRAQAHGLIGMRQRIEAKGGALVVRSVPGKGTSIHASLPLAPAYEPQHAESEREVYAEGFRTDPPRLLGAGASGG